MWEFFDEARFWRRAELRSRMKSAEIRRSIQASSLGVRALARLHGISATSVAKWKRRNSVDDAPLGPRAPKFALTPGEERLVDTIRRYALLPLDDCLHALQLVIPGLSRSTLHRCFQRLGISRVPALASLETEFAPVGVFFVGVDSIQLYEGVRHVCFAVDPESRIIHFDLLERNDAGEIEGFLHGLAASIPYAVKAIATAADQPAFKAVLERKQLKHLDVDRAHPWANGLAMRSVGAPAAELPIIQRSSEELRAHIRGFADRYASSRRLKVLGGMTPLQNLERIRRMAPRSFP